MPGTKRLIPQVAPSFLQILQLFPLLPEPGYQETERAPYLLPATLSPLGCEIMDILAG